MVNDKKIANLSKFAEQDLVEAEKHLNGMSGRKDIILIAYSSDPEPDE